MQRRNPGATAALLQRANSQLKGEKIEKPEDELNAYISSLTKKTSNQKTVNFEDIGESLSISSDIEDVIVRPALEVSSGSKFLKKKPGIENVEPADTGNKFLKKPQVSMGSPSPAVKSQPQQRYGSQSFQSAGSSRPGSQLGANRASSSALDKASAITGKIQQRAATRKTYTLESDSDESFSAMKLARSSGELISESQSESVKIGRDGGKFLKKSDPSPSPAASIEPPRATTTQQKRAISPAKQQQPDQTKKKASPFQLRSSLKYSTDVVLTSEEESLAEFVGGLPSSSDSMDKPRKQYGRAAGRHTPSPPPVKLGKGRRSPSPPPPNKSTGRPSSSKSQGRSVSPQNKPPVIRRTPSPSPRTGERMSPGLRRRSPSPKLMRSYSDDSNVAESIMDEVVDDFGYNVIMDLDELGASIDEELPPRPVTPVSRSESPSPIRSTARKSERDNKRDKKKKKSALKSTSESSIKEKKGRGSSDDRNKSPFKASREKSPFKASSNVSESPFKASSSKERSPERNKQSKSPFRAADTGSPFKASTEGSLFNASGKAKSPFKAARSDRSESERSSSPYKSQEKSSRKSKKDKKKARSKERSKAKSNAANELFSSFGLQTVDDLMGHSIKESEYDSVRSEVEEVRSEISETEEIKTEKPNAYSYSQRFEDSVTEIETEVETNKPSAANYTEDFDSISEKIGYSSDRGKSSASEVRTKYSGEETVASYTEFTESDTETVMSDSKYTDDEDKTYSESYTEYSEDFTKSMVPTSRSDVTPRPRRGMTSAEVQTAMDGLLYSWNPAGSGVAYPGVPYGLHFVDPTPIATQVVSADALEAMTAYSPSMLALHDMLKSQLELTKEFLGTQKQMYEDFTKNIQPSFKYTTLEDTKKYIKKHRRKKLTFKEALQLVDLEMARR